MPRTKDFDKLVEDSIRKALSRVYDKDADWLKAIEIAKDWAKVKHKIEEQDEGSGLGDTPEDPT